MSAHPEDLASVTAANRDRLMGVAAAISTITNSERHMIDLSNLEAKARAATQGEWVYDASPWDDDSKELTTASRVKESIVAIATVDIGFNGIVGTEQQANAAYIAAAQPSVVLELIERIRAAEATAAEPVAWGYALETQGGFAEVYSTKDLAARRAQPGETIVTLYAAPVDTAALAERVKTLEEALAEAKRTIAACDWYWPESDTSSDMCCASAQEVIEGGLPGEVYGVARGGIVEVTYCSYLPPADDADSDDEFWVEEKTEEAAKAAIEAELARREALGGSNE